MPVGRITLIDDDGSGTYGSVIYNATIQQQLDYLDAWVGPWTAVSFSAGNFTGSSGMTWTVGSGDVLANRYRIVDKHLFWDVTLTTTTVAGTPDTELRIACPYGAFATTNVYKRATYVSDNGTYREAIISPVSSSLIKIVLTTGSAWTASTNLTAVYFSTAFELA